MLVASTFPTGGSGGNRLEKVSPDFFILVQPQILPSQLCDIISLTGLGSAPAFCSGGMCLMPALVEDDQGASLQIISANY